MSVHCEMERAPCRNSSSRHQALSESTEPQGARVLGVYIKRLELVSYSAGETSKSEVQFQAVILQSRKWLLET